MKKSIVVTALAAATVIGNVSSYAHEPMMIFLTKGGLPYMDPVLVEVVEEESGQVVFSGSSENSMILIFGGIDGGKTYQIRPGEEEKNVSFKPIRFQYDLVDGMGYPTIVDDEDKSKNGKILENVEVEDRNKEPITEENTEKYNFVKVRVLRNGNPMPNSPIRLMRFDIGIPNIIENIVTDENGEYTFKNFEKNTMYEIRMENTNYKFEEDAIRFETDENGEISKIKDKPVSEEFKGEYTFKTLTQDDKSNVYKLDIMVQDEDGNPQEGVEITANTLSPKLSSYKNSTSDSKGVAHFELEGQHGGRTYSICVSKNGQFSWEFSPETIDITVYEDGRIEVYNDAPKVITVKKNDRNHLKDTIREKIANAEKLIASKDYTEDSKKDLIRALAGAKEEMAKPETIPGYVETFINHLDNGVKKLVRVNTYRGSSISVSASANNKSLKYERIFGSDRIQTSVQISKTKFSFSDTVIIANGYNYVDALSATPLAKSKSAPILLTNGDTISKSVVDEIKRLGAKNIIVVGGESSVSEKSISELSKDVNVERISGLDRYETSKKVADKIFEGDKKSSAILVSGRNFADALSASSLLSKYDGPILLVDAKNDSSSSFRSSLDKYKPSNIAVVGGEASVDKRIDTEYKVAKRYAGSDRYDTSRLVSKDSFTDGGSLYLASGREGADALAIGPVVSREKATVLLVNNENILDSLKNFNFGKLTLVGGLDTLKDIK